MSNHSSKPERWGVMQNRMGTLMKGLKEEEAATLPRGKRVSFAAFATTDEGGGPEVKRESYASTAASSLSTLDSDEEPAASPHRAKRVSFSTAVTTRTIPPAPSSSSRHPSHADANFSRQGAFAAVDNDDRVPITAPQGGPGLAGNEIYSGDEANHHANDDDDDLEAGLAVARRESKLFRAGARQTARRSSGLSRRSSATVRDVEEDTEEDKEHLMFNRILWAGLVLIVVILVVAPSLHVFQDMEESPPTLAPTINEW